MKEQPNKTVSVAVSRNEAKLLGLLRAKKYSRIEIEMNDSEIHCIHVVEDISPSGARVEEIVHSNAFQTVTVTKHQGELVQIKRRIPIKL